MNGGISRRVSGSLSMLESAVNWSLPGIELNAGQSMLFYLD